jgi:NtrC-family two-component system sensor histidine kinase KinB
LVDTQRIQHVFANLISNAIKHSPRNSTIRLSATAAPNDCVEFEVTDRGPGIPEEFQKRIFDRFFRVPKQEKTGAGLGLSIAREIVIAHEGRIGVRSVPGKGSTFFVLLPTK